MTLSQLAKRSGKSVPYLMTLQKKYGLPASKEYSDGYLVLVQKIIYLAICSVPVKAIQSLLTRERKLLEMLKVDSLHDSAHWFEDLCSMKFTSSRLLLSGHDLGHPVNSTEVQTGLDFNERETELFSNKEMGADVLRELKLYAIDMKAVQERIKTELPVIENASKWGHKTSS